MNLLDVFLAAPLPPNACSLSPGEADNFKQLGTFYGNYLRLENKQLLEPFHLKPNEEVWMGIHLVDSPPFTSLPVIVVKRDGRGVFVQTMRNIENTDSPPALVARALEVYQPKCAKREDLKDEIKLRSCRAPLGIVDVKTEGGSEDRPTLVKVIAASDEATYNDYIHREQFNAGLTRSLLTFNTLRHPSLLERSALPLFESFGIERAVKVLPFTMECQLQPNWCWLAVAVSVGRFYEKDAFAWTQCALANDQTGRGDCCQGISGQCSQPEVTPACNVQGALEASLARVGHLNAPMSGTLGFSQVSTEIEGERPIGARIFFPGTGHIVAFTGYSSDATPTVNVEDPFYGPSSLPFSMLTGGLYQGNGTWTHTYTTKG